MERARRLDPLSSSIEVTATWPLLFGGRQRENVSRLESAAAANPNLPLEGMLGEAHALAGDLGRAIPLLEVERARGGDARYAAVLAKAYDAVGRRKDALAIRDDLLAHASEKAYGNCYMLAMAHAALGERAAALSSLERCLAVRNENIILLKVDPQFASLRAEPRFRALLRSIRLDETGPATSQ